MRAVRDEAERAAPTAPRTGPGPSRLRYRLHRVWAKPAVRGLVGVYLPMALIGLIGWRVVSDDDLRRLAETRLAAAWETLAARPEFALKGIEIAGGSEALRARAHAAIGLGAGVSSLAVDVAAIRARIEALDAIRAASVQLDPQGILRVEIDAREAVALYRAAPDTLVLIDADGVRIGHVARRALHPRLPLILGEGGERAVHEVLSLMDGAPDLVPRIRAFVRVGQRRWDIVLEDDRLILLPAEAPGRALARVMALHYGEELLDRDLAVIDMRVPERPTLRLTPQGVEAYRLRQAVVAEGGKDT
ncbi:MAG: cell division protein FtsQ/DivIB [Thermohalobaculum sp.]|nr:cell division protein FtsQ/DivIB [Thermohalobaculum sp.]